MLQHSRPIRHVTSSWHDDGFSCHKNRVSDIIVFKLIAIKKSIKLFWTRRSNALKDDVSIQWLWCSKRAGSGHSKVLHHSRKTCLSSFTCYHRKALFLELFQWLILWRQNHEWWSFEKLENALKYRMVDGSSEEKWKICAWHVMKSKPLAGEGIINKCFFFCEWAMNQNCSSSCKVVE